MLVTDDAIVEAFALVCAAIGTVVLGLVAGATFALLIL